MKWELLCWEKNGLQSGRNASLVGTSNMYNVIVTDQSNTDYWSTVFYISTRQYIFLNQIST